MQPMKTILQQTISSLVFIALLTACNTPAKKAEKSDWQVVKANGFEIKLPANLKTASNLNEDATVQYQNIFKEYFNIVIHESAAEFNIAIIDAELEADYPATIDGYANFNKDRFSENVDEIIHLSDLQSLKLNGLDARYFEARAKVSGTDIFYHYGFVKGDTSYYQVMSWTSTKREADHKATMLESLKSMKETK